MANSIRSHLIRRLLLATVVLVSAGSWFIYYQVQHETEELFDAQLARSARLILSLVQADRSRLEFSGIQNFLDQNNMVADIDSGLDNALENLFREELEALPDGHIYETKLGFQIWDKFGNLLLKSNNLPVTEVSHSKGFGNVEIARSQWRVFSLTSQDGLYRCVTAERIDVRNDLIGEVFQGLLYFFILLIPVLLITMWFAINRGLKPLHSLTSQIQSRSADKLDSISEHDTPVEIKTITDSLNQLLSRLGNALARERRVVSDAAHELRTPLAAVRLHAELASKADNAADRISSINSVLVGIDRSSHLVNQLLTLAKLNPESFGGELRQQNIEQLVNAEMLLQAPFAEKKQIQVCFECTGEISAKVDKNAFHLLLSNLLSNAINYTQSGGRIDIRLLPDNDGFKLIFEDNGPGIPQAERERVFDRFYRLKNHAQTGCGIGLSIVAQVVELHHAILALDEGDQGKGLKVTVSFPSS